MALEAVGSNPIIHPIVRKRPFPIGKGLFPYISFRKTVCRVTRLMYTPNQAISRLRFFGWKYFLSKIMFEIYFFFLNTNHRSAVPTMPRSATDAITMMTKVRSFSAPQTQRLSFPYSCAVFSVIIPQSLHICQ